MAAHLAKVHEVTAWNRTPGRTIVGAAVVKAPEEVVENADVVCLCVTGSEDVQSLLDRLAPVARPGTLFIDHSTIAPATAREVAALCAGRGLRFVDAPVTGGSVGAQNGALTIFLGGEAADVAEAIEVVRPYTKRAERVGPNGAGQTMKLANQIAVAGALQALCETLAFAQKAGLDLAQAQAMIGGGSGGSWAFENYGPRILARDWSPGFSVANQRKDLRYTLETAEELGAHTPGTALVDGLLAHLTAEGRDADTTAALFDILAR